MTRHLGLPHSSHRSSEQSQEIREARRLLKERVRDDWHYDVLPAHRKANSGRVAPVKPVRPTVAGFHIHQSADVDGTAKALHELDVRLLGWQERRYSTASDSEHESVQDKAEFRFEGPDTVRDDIEQWRKDRRWRKRQLLADEMRWNDGLSHWVTRRDLWSGAKTVDQVESKGGSSIQSQPRLDIATEQQEINDGRSSISSSTAHSGDHTSDTHGDATSSSVATTPQTSIKESPDSTAAQTTAIPAEMMLPLTTRILPNHPIRKSISPGMYGEIYSKIVTQGRTPSVPINLQSLVDALVKGWKDDGEWPPKPGVVEPSFSKKKKRALHGSESALKSSVKAVGRVLRLTGIGDSGHAK